MDLGDPDLSLICVLGKGTFGKVYLCKSIKKGQLCCVKKISITNPQVQRQMIKEEINIISQINHPYIVAYERYFIHQGTVNIVMEYLPGGTMRDVINKARYAPLTKQALRAYFCDIFIAVEYLHIRHIIHRDIKPENLMLTLDQRVKIGDFGISAVHSDKKYTSRSLGTPLYAAPEIMQGEKGYYTADMWSLGCIIFEICSGRHPFGDAQDIIDLMDKVQQRTRTKMNCQHITPLYGAGWSSLCESMLIYDAKKRIIIPNIVDYDPFLTVNFLHKYFDYKY